MKRKEKKEACMSCPEDICAQIIAETDTTEEIIAPSKTNQKKAKTSASEKIYRFLDAAERVAIILKNNQNAKKKKAKKQLKKNKKVGKIDKKTGAVVLKKVKKDKVQKPMKRYKPPKKK